MPLAMVRLGGLEDQKVDHQNLSRSFHDNLAFEPRIKTPWVEEPQHVTPKAADSKETIEKSDQLEQQQQTDKAVNNTTLKKRTEAPKTLQASVKWIQQKKSFSVEPPNKLTKDAKDLPSAVNSRQEKRQAGQDFSRPHGKKNNLILARALREPEAYYCKCISYLLDKIRLQVLAFLRDFIWFMSGHQSLSMRLKFLVRFVMFLCLLYVNVNLYFSSDRIT